MERKKQELDLNKNSDYGSFSKKQSSKRTKSYLDKGIDSILSTISRSIGRAIARGILGSIKKL